MTVYLQRYDVQRRVIHEKIHTLIRFLVHTTNVQCVRAWSPGTHPNGNPVPSRRSVACFHHSSSDAFLPCLQRCCHWYINLVLHISLQEEITWREIWRLGGHGNRGTSSRPALPIQRCGSSLLRKSPAI
ncbi:hypothetical protein AVEN_262673-1 [Araneus ventricosus]|uniref:Uncharacterized protein n=1 Tax=Araneus ventricosus TaxID=182803 RepID=A0A4Y2RQN3_ARAVE|nr:hypothetical protein AVEN_262673-1 [Araneus ventricosus]